MRVGTVPKTHRDLTAAPLVVARPRRTRVLSAPVLSVLFLACVELREPVRVPAAVSKPPVESAKEPTPPLLESPARLEPPVPPALKSPHCVYGCPRAQGGEGPVLLREQYALCNNPRTKFADWVAYHVTAETIGKSPPRKWVIDPDLPPDTTMAPEAFRGAYAALGTDRGHQVPLASFGSTDKVQQLNYLSNVTPQKSALNQQLWRKLEEAERELAQRERAGVYVVTGPLYEREMPSLPGTKKSHRVPSGYFKIVFLEVGDGERASAFVVEQEVPRSADFCDYQVVIREIEMRSGWDFFSDLPDDREEALETTKGTLAPLLGCEPLVSPPG